MSLFHNVSDLCFKNYFERRQNFMRFYITSVWGFSTWFKRLQKHLDSNFTRTRMENPDQDKVVLKSFQRTSSVPLSTDDSSEPQREQQNESEPEPESSQETPEPKSDPPLLVLIDFRIEQLLNRRSILMRMQDLKKKAGHNSGWNKKEMTCGDSDEGCELEAVQKELDELLVKKEELEKQLKSLTPNGGQQDACPSLTPCGGIYTLPSSQLMLKTRRGAETATGPVIPVDSLARASAATRCPSCEEVVCTETSNKVGGTVWLICCLCSMIGCFTGCCLIPFFVEKWKDVHHQCPQCQAHIYTYHPI